MSTFGGYTIGAGFHQAGGTYTIPSGAFLLVNSFSGSISATLGDIPVTIAMGAYIPSGTSINLDGSGELTGQLFQNVQ